MTKKRFKYHRNNDGTSMIYDKEKQEYYFCVDFDNICNELNILYEENQALKSDRVRYEEECRLDIFKELSEENQQLKNKLKFLNELNKPYGAIIEENTRLKAFIKRLTNDCGEIVLMNGVGYKVDKILEDYE